jgi:hypothetical protein
MALLDLQAMELSSELNGCEDYDYGCGCGRDRDRCGSGISLLLCD